MARKKIREHRGKTLLRNHIERLGKVKMPFRTVQVTAQTNLKALAEEPEHAWLKTEPLVCKPDMLFGKRGKHDLVGLNLDLAGVEAFVAERMGKVIEMGTLKGALTHFIVEPFIPHKEEYYMNIMSVRDGNKISFSPAGGVEVEENWDKVKTVGPVRVTVKPEELDLDPLFGSDTPAEFVDALKGFIRACYAVFLDLDFTLMEFNPFIIDPKTNTPFPLDMRAELDDYASFKNMRKWSGVDFPPGFGRDPYPAEDYINGLDEKSGASMKLTVLNPKGRIWTMVAGGGASVIYADTIVDLGMGDEMANYGEYSGNPTESETFNYARTVLELATANPNEKQNKALLIGGGVANFTNVALTFKGIIAAIRNKQEDLKKANMRIYVRRGGPNYREGLRQMRELGTELGLTIEVFGPEKNMTEIVPMAIAWINSESS